MRSYRRTTSVRIHVFTHRPLARVLPLIGSQHSRRDHSGRSISVSTMERFTTMLFHRVRRHTPSVWGGGAPARVVSPSPAKKEFLFFRLPWGGCSKSRRCLEGNHVSPLRCHRRERYALRLSD